jgi:hypothetical protein
VTYGLATVGHWLVPEIGRRFWPMFHWFFPAPLARGLSLAALGVTLAAAVVFLRTVRTGEKPKTSARLDQPTRTLLAVLAIFVLCYAAFLLVTICFVYASVALDRRMLPPVYVSFLVMALCLLGGVLEGAAPARILRVAAAALCLAFAVRYVVTLAVWLPSPSRDDMNYASPRWKDSEVMKRLAALPAATPVYTNAPDAVYFWTGKPDAYSLPARFDPQTLRPNARYVFELEAAKSDLLKRRGIVAFFDNVTWTPYVPSEEELSQAWPLERILRAPDGVIYALSTLSANP